MLQDDGFTLIETLTAMLILLMGLVAVAFLFIYSAKTNWTNRQRTVASLLLQEKLDEFKAIPFSDPAWDPGQYSDHSGQYLRTWRISGAPLKSLTVVVYADRAGLTNRLMELTRATTMAAP